MDVQQNFNNMHSLSVGTQPLHVCDAAKKYKYIFLYIYKLEIREPVGPLLVCVKHLHQIVYKIYKMWCWAHPRLGWGKVCSSKVIPEKEEEPATSDSTSSSSSSWNLFLKNLYKIYICSWTLRLFFFFIFILFVWRRKKMKSKITVLLIIWSSLARSPGFERKAISSLSQRKRENIYVCVMYIYIKWVESI